MDQSSMLVALQKLTASTVKQERWFY